MRKNFVRNRIAGVVCAALLGMGGIASAEVIAHETIYQPALLQSLTAGYYDGFVTMHQVHTMGDTGLGTFDGVNGEMIMLDGHIYQALGDATVVEAPETETTPFCTVTYFEEDGSFDVKNVQSLADLKKKLDEVVSQNGRNNFYMVRVDGDFEEVYARSERKQIPPYEPLVKVLERDQVEYSFSDVKGTIVAVYCPPYMSQLNASGWHFHFISDDRKKGGHVFEMKLRNGIVSYDITREFHMVLPKGEEFSKLDLAKDQSKDIQKVEQGK